MAEQLCKLFIEKVCPTILEQKQKEMERVLNLMIGKNITDLQFFIEFKNKFDMPIHYIEKGYDEEKKLNSHEYFHLEANKWKTTDIEELLKLETCILLLLKDNNFGHVATFTSDWTNDLRIELFLKSDDAIMVQIGIDLLMKNSKSPKLRYMCENLNVCSENSYGKKLFQILYETNRNDAIEFILQNECEFPVDTNEKQIPLVEARLKSNKNFHEFIKEGKIDAIEKFLKGNSNLQYIYNECNMSACAVAINEKKFKIYHYLRDQNLTIRNQESNLLKKPDFLVFFSLNPPRCEKYTDKLLQMLTWKTSTVNKSNTNLNVDGIYKQLIDIPKFDLILNILYNLKPLYIILDYQEKSISKICCYVFGHIRGLYDPTLNRIFISGGGGTEQMLGTFAHEFTHLMMGLLYNNGANPYKSDDLDRKRHYKKIVQDIHHKEKKGRIKEEIIKLVYNYSSNKWDAELIVRVNHILAYYGYKKGTEILNEIAPELFKFYYDQIVPDLENYLRTQVNRNDYSYIPFFIQEIEKKCQEYTLMSNNLLASVTQTPGHVVIKTNCVHLTCMKLFSNITATESVNYNLNNTYMVDLKTIINNKKQASAHFQNYELLIVADEAVENQSDVNAWKNINDYVNASGKRLICVIEKEQTVPFQTTKYEDVCQWTDFDEKSRKLIFNQLEVNFQGNKIKLSKLIDYEDNSHVINNMLSIHMIRNCMFGQSLLSTTVGTTLSKNSTYYIERELTTTIFELDELADGKIFKYNCENIADTSEANTFNLILNNKDVIKFPGKKIQIDSKSAGLSLEFNNRWQLITIFERIKDEIFIFSSKKRAQTSIFVDYDKEIVVNDFSYADLLTFEENNKKESNNLHWFMESDEQDYLFYHLKTFGTLEKIRNRYQRKGYKIGEYELFEKLAHQKICLIAATAGMGKTETMKSLAQRLVRNNPSTWAPVVILIKNTKLLKEFNADKANLDNIFDFLVEFLQLKSNLEKELFKHCCTKKNSNVYLFLDGADEISPIYTTKIYKIIEILSKTNIKCITVSVRLNMKADFENKLSTVAIELKPLTHEDQIKCMSNIWRNEQIRQVDNFEEISRRVIKQFRSFDNFLNNPLQIKLVANICKEKLDVFSKKLKAIPSFFANETFLMKIYEKFIDEKLEIAVKERSGLDLNKPAAKDPAEFYKDATKRQVKLAAITTLLDDEEVKLFLSESDIEANKKFSKKVKTLETYEGIVDGTISGKLHFVHRTYAEYFFADFLINDCCYRDKKEREYFFFDVILVKEQFQYVRTFLNSYKGKIKNLSIKPTHYQIPVTLHDAVVQNIEENNTEILKNLHTLEFNFTINPSTLISKYINNDSPNSIVKLIDTIKYLVSKCGKVRLSINELRQIKKILFRIHHEYCIELIKALLHCDLIDLSADALVQDQRNSFLSLWDEAKAKVEADPKNRESTRLPLFFYEMLEKIN